MMKYGPVDVTVLAFAEARLDGSALAELKRQVATGIIRVLDIIILFKDEAFWFSFHNIKGKHGTNFPMFLARSFGYGVYVSPFPLQTKMYLELAHTVFSSKK